VRRDRTGRLLTDEEIRAAEERLRVKEEEAAAAAAVVGRRRQRRAVIEDDDEDLVAHAIGHGDGEAIWSVDSELLAAPPPPKKQRQRKAAKRSDGDAAADVDAANEGGTGAGGSGRGGAQRSMGGGAREREASGGGEGAQRKPQGLMGVPALGPERPLLVELEGGDSFEVPGSINKFLRPYQRDGVSNRCCLRGPPGSLGGGKGWVGWGCSGDGGVSAAASFAGRHSCSAMLDRALNCAPNADQVSAALLQQGARRHPGGRHGAGQDGAGVGAGGAGCRCCWVLLLLGAAAAGLLTAGCRCCIAVSVTVVYHVTPLLLLLLLCTTPPTTTHPPQPQPQAISFCAAILHKTGTNADNLPRMANPQRGPAAADTTADFDGFEEGEGEPPAATGAAQGQRAARAAEGDETAPVLVVCPTAVVANWQEE